MQADRPKQYLPLMRGQTVLEATLARLFTVPVIDHIHLVLADHDEYWPTLPLASDDRVIRVSGGRERCHSIMNALETIAAKVSSDDLVLVHDAARPCVRTGDIEKLIEVCTMRETGGLLAVPVRDTMKLSTDSDAVFPDVENTLERSRMWHALTPQVFRFELLLSAMRKALQDGFEVTDESSAVEYLGHRPLLVEGHADNLKITRPEDLALARFYLEQQG